MMGGDCRGDDGGCGHNDDYLPSRTCGGGGGEVKLHEWVRGLGRPSIGVRVVGRRRGEAARAGAGIGATFHRRPRGEGERAVNAGARWGERAMGAGALSRRRGLARRGLRWSHVWTAVAWRQGIAGADCCDGRRGRAGGRTWACERLQ
jgi:hypothetical protein